MAAEIRVKVVSHGLDGFIAVRNTSDAAPVGKNILQISQTGIIGGNKGRIAAAHSIAF